MYAWEAGEHEILEEDRACTCVQYHSTSRGGGGSQEHRAKIYLSLVLHGKLQLVFR